MKTRTKAAILLFCLSTFTFPLFGNEQEDLTNALKKEIPRYSDGKIDMKEIGRLLDAGADPNGRYDTTKTFLRHAARERMVQLAQVLLEHGADPNLSLDQETDPAVFFGNREITELFIAHGARFDVFNVIVDYGKLSPLLYQVVYNVPSALLILEWEQQHSPNFCAHYENRKDYLTAVFARLLSTRYSDRERVVSYTLAERLIDEGVDPAAPYEGGFPIAYLTVVHNERDQYIIPLLIERGAPVDAFNKDGETALYCAVYAKNLALADFLLKKGADINQQNKEDGQTALMVARSEEMMRFLLERGANPNLQDDRRRTVLMEYWIKREFINLLFQYGADPAIKDKDGRTVMFIWSWEDLDGAMIDELISRGCPINEPDNRGLTPLIYAADTASSGSKPQEFIITLLEKGADPNYRDLKGRTALHIYLLGIERWFRKDDKDLPVITALLEAGTRPADKDDDGDSALTTALRLPSMDRKMAHIRKLVRQYADAEDIKIAAAAARKEKKEDTREMLSEYLPPTIGALSVPLILGGLSFFMREVAFKDNPSGNIMGPVNAGLTLGTGGFFLGFLMGGAAGDGLGAVATGFVGALMGGIAGIIVGCIPSVFSVFNNNPVLYYAPTIISVVIASVVIFDIWF